MNGNAHRRYVRGIGLTSLGTLASRLLGLVRDIVTASLLGLGQGGVMDALVVALRIPNFSRRVLGEGALAASFLPVFTREHDRSADAAWRMLSALLASLGAVTTLLVVAGELVCLFWWRLGDGSSPLAGLTAVVLPYLALICLAAQLAAALQGLSKFRWPALAPAVLNLCWLAAAWFVAPWFDDQLSRAYVIAAAVVVSGALQCAVLVPPLVRSGFRFQWEPHGSWFVLRPIVAAMIPIALALAVTQINTLVDSLLAVTLAGPPDARLSLGWFGEFRYPLETGAAAAMYYGERFSQLPVGIVGIAIATVLYPALARHASRGDRPRLGADLSFGLRWVCFLAIPAGIGLMLVAGPLMEALFVRGAFTRHDAQRAAAMIACYASAAWAYCALPILARGFYSLEDRVTPLRVGVLAVATDIAASLVLIGPFAERALALSTAVAAIVQVVLLTGLIARSIPLAWGELRASLARCLAATAVMALVVHGGVRSIPLAELSRLGSLFAITALIVAGAAAYLLAARLLGSEELKLLVASRPAEVSERWMPAARQAMISRIGWPKSMSRRFRPGTSSRRGSTPSSSSTVA